MKKFFVIFLLLFSLNVYAEDWKFVIASDNEEISVDTTLNVPSKTFYIIEK